jgi:uncharacterized protein YaaR (DUF327 family)
MNKQDRELFDAMVKEQGDRMRLAMLKGVLDKIAPTGEPLMTPRSQKINLEQYENPFARRGIA